VRRLAVARPAFTVAETAAKAMICPIRQAAFLP
jgi:hypothetical protein